MKNKEKLALILSGLITLNTLVVCSIQKQSQSAYNKMPEEKTIITNSNLKPSPKTQYSIPEPNYTVNTTLASVRYDENGDVEYYVPEGWVLVGDMAYQVVVEKSEYTYPAAVKENEDGIKVYYAPNGGILSGSTVVVPAESVILESDMAREYLEENGYIQKEDATLTKTFN